MRVAANLAIVAGSGLSAIRVMGGARKKEFRIGLKLGTPPTDRHCLLPSFRLRGTSKMYEPIRSAKEHLLSPPQRRTLSCCAPDCWMKLVILRVWPPKLANWSDALPQATGVGHGVGLVTHEHALARAAVLFLVAFAIFEGIRP